MDGDFFSFRMALDAQGGSVAENTQAVPGANRSDCGSMRGGPRWYAIATKHRQSHAAMLAVQDLGFPAFLPWVSCPLPKGARELRPMFGNYLFARFDAGRDAWGALTRLPCVPDRPVLCLAGRATPAPIADRVIDALYRNLGRPIEVVAMDASGRRVIADPVGVLVSVGAEVRLADGRGGEVLALRRGGREAIVAFDGWRLPVWVPVDRLELLA